MLDHSFDIGDVSKIRNQEINQRSLKYINDKTKNKTEISHYSFGGLQHTY